MYALVGSRRLAFSTLSRALSNCPDSSWPFASVASTAAREAFQRFSACCLGVCCFLPLEQPAPARTTISKAARTTETLRLDFIGGLLFPSLPDSCDLRDAARDTLTHSRGTRRVRRLSDGARVVHPLLTCCHRAARPSEPQPWSPPVAAAARPSSSRTSPRPGRGRRRRPCSAASPGSSRTTTNR